MRVGKLLVPVLIVAAVLTGCRQAAVVQPKQYERWGERTATQPMAASDRPNFLARYLWHRWDDLRDVFGVRGAIAPPWRSYGVDLNIGIMNAELGLGYLRVKGAQLWAIEGRGTYGRAVYDRKCWRFLWLGRDGVITQIPENRGNRYINPERKPYKTSRYYKHYRQWIDTMCTKAKGAYHTNMLLSDKAVPAQRLVHSSDKDGDAGAYYTGATDGWQRSIGAIRFELAFPGDPFVLKGATNFGVSFNWCQVIDLVVGLVPTLDPYGDDVFTGPKMSYPTPDRTAQNPTAADRQQLYTDLQRPGLLPEE